MNFWDFNAWGGINLLAVILLALFIANMIKRNVPFLKRSLIPTSVLAGLLLFLVTSIIEWISGVNVYSTNFFGNVGTGMLELITYHALALGFIATAFTSSKREKSKKRNVEILNTGVTTVSTYLMQAILGLGITLIVGLLTVKICNYCGIILPFGFGQGTGQALNWGTIYQTEHGFTGGANFGLTIAALGFLSASFGGVIYLNIHKKRFKDKVRYKETSLNIEQVQEEGEIPMNGSIDKITFQIAFIFISYCLTFLVMMGLSALIPSMQATIFGFNFLIGVLMASLIKVIVSFLKKKNVIKRQYTNTFLMKRLSGFFFDVMVVAGIAAIRIELLKDYWWIALILGVVGLTSTYLYNSYMAKTLFKDYQDEQFLMMYGMLTGTASTGMVLLKEIDGELKTPASENLVYQNFPAIVLGFPIMLLANIAPTKPVLVLIILTAMFIVLNLFLFRSKIFKRPKKQEQIKTE